MPRKTTTKPKLDWLSLSEITAGLMLQGKIAPNAVPASDLIEPYSALAESFSGQKKFTQEQAILAVGPIAYNTALEAASAVNGLAPANWIGMLSEASAKHQAGVMLEKYAARLKRGEDVDLTPMTALAKRASRRERLLTPLSEIEPLEDYFVPVGYQPLDDYLGGLPGDSSTLVLGPPGVGKTWFGCKLAACYVKHTGQSVAWLSLEMTMQQLATRMIVDMNVPKKYRDKILIADQRMGVDDIVGVAVQQEKAGLVIVDFAEQILDNDSSEAATARVNREIAGAARDLHKIFVVLAQMTKASIAQGGMPYLGAGRYSGISDAMTALELGLYNPKAIWIGRTFDDNGRERKPPVELEEGNGGIVAIKSRYGFLSGLKYEVGGPGVIEVPFLVTGGWGDKALKYHRLG